MTAPTEPDFATSLEMFFEAWPLFRHGILASIFAGTLLGVLGVYVLMRRMVFLSAAVAQASGLGVAVAFWVAATWGAAGEVHTHALAGTPTVASDASWLVATFSDPLLVSLAVAIVVTLLLALRDDRTHSEALLALVYLAATAGMLLLSYRTGREQHDIRNVFIGDPMLVMEPDYELVLWLALTFGLLHLLFARGFLQTSFDAEGARVRGLPVRFLDVGLLVTLAVTLSVCTRVIGAMTTFAFSVLPAMAAVRLVTNAKRALWLAGTLGGALAYGGFAVAFVYDVPVGTTMTLLAVGLVAVAELVSRLKRLVRRLRTAE